MVTGDDQVHDGDGEEAGTIGEADRPADWGAWLRTRLEQAAGLEADPAEEADDGAEATAATAPVGNLPPVATEDELGPEPHQAGEQAEEALPSVPGPDLSEELAALHAEVVVPPSGPDAHPAEERAAVMTPPPAPDPDVARGFAALRSANDDVTDRLDALTAAIITQGAELGERIDRQAAVTAERLDRALEAMAGQQSAVLGALGELLDRRHDTDPDEDRRDSLDRLTSELTAGRAAAAIQAAELADIGSRLDRLQEALDRLGLSAGPGPVGGELPEGPPHPGDARVVELDDDQAAAIAAAVAAMLSDGSPASRPPTQGASEPVAPVEEEASPPAPPAPGARPRRRATPLRAATARPRAPSEDDAGPTPAWHPGER